MIDDVEGRDMPLLRAEVGSLDMTHESGPGMARCVDRPVVVDSPFLY